MKASANPVGPEAHLQQPFNSLETMRTQLLSASLLASLLSLSTGLAAASPTYQFRMPLKVNVQPSGAEALAFDQPAMSLNGIAGQTTFGEFSITNAGTATSSPIQLALQGLPSNLSLDESCSNISLGAGQQCSGRIKLDSTAAGTWSGRLVASSAPSSAVTLPITVATSANSALAKVTALSVAPASVAANGTAYATGQATVHDYYGNLLGANVPVYWQSTLGTLSSTSSLTNDLGVATIRLSATQPGTASLYAKAAGDTEGGVASISFVPDTASARVDSIAADATSRVASTSEFVTLSAILKDSSGNLLGAGVPVTWAVSPLGSLESSTTTTNASGVASVRFNTGTVAGTTSVTAATAADTTGKSSSITVTADTASAKASLMTATPATLTANNVDESTIRVVLRDQFNNTVPSTTVQWSTNLGKLNAATSVTGTNGTASIRLVAGKASGTANVLAKGPADTAGMTKSVTFTSDASTALVKSVSSSASSLAATGSTKSTLTATVQDANGNSLGAGIAVNWSTSLGSLSAATTATDAQGVATVTLTSSTTLGTATVSANTAANSTSSSTSVTFVPDYATAQVTDFSAVLNPARTGATNGTDLIAIVKDAYGHQIEGATVLFQASTGTVTGSATTNKVGTGFGKLTSLTTGNITVLSYTSYQGSGGGKALTITFQSPP